MKSPALLRQVGSYFDNDDPRLGIAGSVALSWYLSNFSNYSATYGSLGAAIGLMMWLWMSATIVLFGAELNSEIERQTAVDGGNPKWPERQRAIAD